MVGPFSPRLTLSEKSALKKIEEGDFQGGVQSFLRASFSLVEQALRPHFEEIDLDAILALRIDDSVPDLIPIKKLFWEDDEVTSWGELFLEWEEEEVSDDDLYLDIDQLNDYLLRSLDFYEALEVGSGPEQGRVFTDPSPEVEPQPVAVPALHPQVIADESVELNSPPPVETDDDTFEDVLEDLIEEESLEDSDSEEYGGRSWETIRVETIYWPKLSKREPRAEESEPEEELPEEELPEQPDGKRHSETLGGSSWDSIKVETIFWPKGTRTPVLSESERQQEVRAEKVSPAPRQPAADPMKVLKHLATAVAEAEGREKPPAIEHPAEEKPEEKKAAKPPPEFKQEEGEELLLTHAPDDPFSKKNRLVVKNKYLGYGKNSEGVIGLCGQLKISYFNQKELEGRLESSNPLLFLSSKRLSGSNCTVTYWLPPVAFPHPAGDIAIQTPHGGKRLSLHTLFPKSRTDLMRDRSIVLCLLLPALLGFLYFALVYILTAQSIDLEAQQTFPELYREALQGIDSGSFRSQGLGLYRLRVVPASESLQMIWAAVIFFAPLLTAKFFYYLSRSRKRRYGGLLAASLLLPSVLLLLSWSFQDAVFPLYSHQDFVPLDLRGFLGWGVVMNLCVAVYLFLSVLGVWDRNVTRPEVRFALPVVLTGLYCLTLFVIIYGRSWFS